MPLAARYVRELHGRRLDFDDPDEMLRSFLIGRAPGHSRLFPEDVTPVNLVPRILNTYAGTRLPLATEDSSWVDPGTLDFHGSAFTLTPRIVSAP